MQFDWWTFALQVVNFLILVWLLQHFLYGPVQSAYSAVRDRIPGAIRGVYQPWMVVALFALIFILGLAHLRRAPNLFQFLIVALLSTFRGI